jgi:aerobic-type carbon monoxide dehydrogenase small subunit (CoxS/CutS family)
MTNQIMLIVNDAELNVVAAPNMTLLSFLREQLDLTGAKIGCAEGSCGACTVLVDDLPVRACVTPLAAIAGRSVHTIEGLAAGGELHPLQQAFLDQGAFQCGYCTPGMIMAGTGVLAAHPDADEETIARLMQGNLCRCGMYARIVRAIRQAAGGS